MVSTGDVARSSDAQTFNLGIDAQGNPAVDRVLRFSTRFRLVIQMLRFAAQLITSLHPRRL